MFCFFFSLFVTLLLASLLFFVLIRLCVPVCFDLCYYVLFFHPGVCLACSRFFVRYLVCFLSFFLHLSFLFGFAFSCFLFFFWFVFASFFFFYCCFQFSDPHLFLPSFPSVLSSGLLLGWHRLPLFLLAAPPGSVP